jgi:hypothetical protein
MKRTNNIIRGLIKAGVIVIMILSIPVKAFNYFMNDFHWRKHNKLEH